MAYQTLYRKWRPQTFDEVVGQTHITNTLKNEIVNGKTAHAYMFTGTRGTGKTSTAKILSRAINCENNHDGNPCNECPTCLGIINESILDVVEMDAASNNSVENIREIIDQVRYSTASSKYKVYIIDEVHMLSMHCLKLSKSLLHMLYSYWLLRKFTRYLLPYFPVVSVLILKI